MCLLIFGKIRKWSKKYFPKRWNNFLWKFKFFTRFITSIHRNVQYDLTYNHTTQQFYKLRKSQKEIIKTLVWDTWCNFLFEKHFYFTTREKWLTIWCDCQLHSFSKHLHTPTFACFFIIYRGLYIIRTSLCKNCKKV